MNMYLTLKTVINKCADYCSDAKSEFLMMQTKSIRAIKTIPVMYSRIFKTYDRTKWHKMFEIHDHINIIECLNNMTT